MIKRICKNCNKLFLTWNAEIRKGGGKFCSCKCYYISKLGEKHTPDAIRKMSLAKIGKKLTESAKRKISIANKGKIAWNKGKHPEYVQGKNHPMYGVDRSGSKGAGWKGGRVKRKDGYVFIYKPDHPQTIKENKYVLEHRLVMEKHLGRYLTPEEVVHHKNGNPSDNRIENLELFPNNSKHFLLHDNFRERNDKGQFVKLSSS